MPRGLLKQPGFDVAAFSDMRCPMQGLLNLLGGPWTTYILWLIRSHGEMRFGQLRKQIPNISAKMLTERLRMLESAGIVSRCQENTIPPKVSYSLTKRGHDLDVVLDQINALALKWGGGKGEQPDLKSA